LSVVRGTLAGVIEGVLRRQVGVISREQALAAGLTSAAIGRRLAAGRWERLHPGVYIAADRELNDRAWLYAAALHGGESATVSGVAAAWWHELWPKTPDTIELTVPQQCHVAARPGLRIRRRDLSNLDRVNHAGLWVTSLPLTVLEAAVALGPDGSQLLDRALQRRVHFETVHRAHCRNIGRHGSAAAGRLLTAAADRAASQAERVMIGLLRAANLTGWERGHWVGGFELDFAFPRQRVAIEVDGWAWHWDAERFRHDRRRQNGLELAGWTVLRFTWHDLTNRPAEVVAEIRRALASRAAA
jgi:very-short-patch-repair endonuclease